MEYTVEFFPDAEQNLVRIWVERSFSQVIFDASKRLEALLREDAHELGESRTDDRRIVFAEPLGAIFSVDVVKAHVVVQRIWYYEKPSGKS